VLRFREQHGVDPPWFLVLSPGHACNLRCPGCYADSGKHVAALPWSTLDRVMQEARDLWGVPLFVLSGGEPLLYRSEGKDILDAVEKHDDSLFLMFTNGTLIDERTADRLAELGNLTPALSVEGLRAATDRRRGDGTFDRVLRSMRLLREAGVPFGISVTATHANCEEILSDEVLDTFFEREGAFYAFVFQYMPIGRSPDVGNLPTAEQQAAFWRRSWEVIAERQIFLLDFWNHGPLVEGCISAGREKGYLYIDWHGNVMPCVFVPYAAANVCQVFESGGNLDDIWQLPFFEAIRSWQRAQGYGSAELPAECNWLRPCPFRDHYGTLRSWIDTYRPEPADEAARKALLDEPYQNRMSNYAAEGAGCLQRLWNQAYVGPAGSSPQLAASGGVETGPGREKWNE
jgi:MoaA/NifB/PqqE/SkfB family radical SAM enzyme